MKPLLLLAVLTSLASAQGPLTPPGAPAPTMKTLAQIEPRTPLGGNPTAFVNITNPGSYYLVSDVAGLGINASSITLDLNGFTVKEAINTLGIGIGTGFKDISIRNGSVVGSGVWTQGAIPKTGTYSGNAGFGIYTARVLGLVSSQGINIEKVTVRGFYTAIALDGFSTISAGRNRISNCIVRDFGSAGIDANTTDITDTIVSNGSGVGVRGVIFTTENLLIYQIDGNGLEDNGASIHRGTVVREISFYGIKGGNFSISGANISSCGADGIRGDSLQIENCTSSYNDSAGIFSPNSTIKNCLARANGNTGIWADNSVISDCKVREGATDGIRGDNSSISAVVVTSCGGNGIRGNNSSISAAAATNCVGNGILGDSLQIENCTAANNTGSGIFSPNSTIKNCMARGNQGIWLEKLRNWGGVEDERDGLGGFALIGLKPTR